MGSSASKPARAAANTVSRRQYPKQPSSASMGAAKARTESAPETKAEPVQRPQGPTYHSKEQPTKHRTDVVDLDGRDPHFAASLRSIGPVHNPAPTMSNTSTFNRLQQGPPGTPMQTVFPEGANPAMHIFAARQRATKAAEREAEEFGRTSHGGREYLDALTIRQALSMRDRAGVPPGEIERALRLKEGVLGRLGGKGVVGEIS